MMKPLRLLLSCLLLTACHGTPPQREQEDWTEFMRRVGKMDAPQLALAREDAMQRLALQPTDVNRLRAGYLLSRPSASLEQLAQSLEVMAGVSDRSELSPLREVLSGEIRQSMELQKAEMGRLELQTQLDRLKTRLGELQAQLDALKAIEQEMIESQQSSDDFQP